MKKGFTLVELLVVIGIMGLLGTVSVGGYRAMQRGMEERSVMQSVNSFVRAAYQRAQIDRQPVVVYFWNETIRKASDDFNEIVVGRAVAVRKLGRITAKDGQKLLDEFGDLEVYGCKDEDGKLDAQSTDYQSDSGTWLYRVNGDEQNFQRTLVSRFTVPSTDTNIRMISYPQTEAKEITSYGYFILPDDKGGVDWKKGDAYGLEFGDFSLPQRYIFGNTFSTSVANPNTEVKVMNFNPLGGNDGGSQTIDIGAIRPNAQGAPEAKRIDKTVAPSRDQQEQNE